MPEPLDPLFLSFQAALAGRYSLERELGRGGMGIVYLAREVRLDRLVAIKLLPPGQAARPELRERFLREARTAARLSQPNIIPIHTVDEVGDFVFYVMAYVNGETLARRVASRGPLPPAEAARILREVAWALAYAHAQGVVHRDIKPENIILESGSGRAMVADFGIARVAQASGGTGVGEVLGTPQFMSPEQASGEKVDGRSDLYALGVVGYYVLSARLPFEGPNAAAILAQHLTQPAPPVVAVAPAVPRALARAIERCLAKDPGQRFASGEELAEALSDALEARREVPVPVRVLLKRTRRLVLAAVGLDFVLLAFFVDVLRHRGTAGPGETLAYAVGLGALMIGGPIAVLVRQARWLVKRGYGQADLTAGLKVELDRTREEAQFEYGGRPAPMERVLRIGSAAAIGVAVLSAGAMLVLGPPYNLLSGFAAYFALVAGLGALRRRNERQGKPMALDKLWGSAIGRWLFRVASVGLKGAAPVAHRPTELAIGTAAATLFEELPKETRRALGDLPGTLQRLEGHAQRIRARIDDLDRMLAEAERAAGRTGMADQRQALAAELRAAREQAERCRAQVVAALETIRLDLLRLRGGVGTVETITADLAAAREVGEQIDRLLAGQREVKEALKRA